MAGLVLKMTKAETIVIDCGGNVQIKIDCDPRQDEMKGKNIQIDAPREFEIRRVPKKVRLTEGS